MIGLDNACGVCGHAFRSHWLTHDRLNQGCVARVTSEDAHSTTNGPCDCHAFMVPWEPEPQHPFLSPHPPGARGGVPGTFEYGGRVLPPGGVPTGEDVEWERQP